MLSDVMKRSRKSDNSDRDLTCLPLRIQGQTSRVLTKQPRNTNCFRLCDMLWKEQRAARSSPEKRVINARVSHLFRHPLCHRFLELVQFIFEPRQPVGDACGTLFLVVKGMLGGGGGGACVNVLLRQVVLAGLAPVLVWFSPQNIGGKPSAIENMRRTQKSRIN